MPKCYQLVGVPGSGKSTWIADQLWAKNIPVISTDFYVEKFARRLGKTYNEVFDTVMPRAIRLMMRAVRKAQQGGNDLVWDQTSTTVPSRARKFASLPDYTHIAIVFKTPERKELDRRLANRPAKVIPQYVMQLMLDGFDPPTEDEGFSEIWYV